LESRPRPVQETDASLFVVFCVDLFDQQNNQTVHYSQNFLKKHFHLKMAIDLEKKELTIENIKRKGITVKRNNRKKRGRLKTPSNDFIIGERKKKRWPPTKRPPQRKLGRQWKSSTHSPTISPSSCWQQSFAFNCKQ
jgi:hypothetical protein